MSGFRGELILQPRPILFVGQLLDAQPGECSTHIVDHLTLLTIMLVSIRRIGSALPVMKHRHSQQITGGFHEVLAIGIVHLSSSGSAVAVEAPPSVFGAASGDFS